MQFSKSLHSVIRSTLKRSLSQFLTQSDCQVLLRSKFVLSGSGDIQHFGFYSKRMGSFLSCQSKDYTIHGDQQNTTTREYSNMSDIIEAEVCNEDDIPDEGMKSFPVAGTDNGKVLIVKSKGKISAIGTKCTHYGAPLEKGVICNGQVKCPFHGACFSLETGDIEEFPGLDSIPRYDVEVNNGKVKIRASRKQLTENRRRKEMTKCDPSNPEVYALLGGGAASMKCAETLRQEGFTGQIKLFTSENVLPYDRPKLSKAMHLSADSLTLRDKIFFEEADIEVYMNATVASVNASKMSFSLSDGSTTECDKMFIATGGSPRKLTVPGADLPDVFVLRTPEDANKIVTRAKDKRIIIVGSSFIGMEAAAYFASDNRAASVTVVGSSATPFEKSLGQPIGDALQKWFQQKGVTFVNRASITEIQQDQGQINQVVLGDGRIVEGDIVVAGVGVVPATTFLSGSGIFMNERGYVPVNETLQTNISSIYCGGDIASFPLFLEDNRQVAIGHWQIAHNHGHVAALNMVGKETPVRTVPFFWTVLFGKSLRYAGYGVFDDVIVDGSLDELKFIAYYCQGDRVVAVSSLMQDPAVAKFAGHLQAGNILTKQQVIADGQIALKL